MKQIIKNNSKPMKFLLSVFVVWQLLILLISTFSPMILFKRERFMYNDGSNKNNPKFLWSRANFDGIIYLSISREGYQVNQQAFFPIYPKLIKIFAPIFANKVLVAGIFISTISFMIMAHILMKLIRIDFNLDVAKETIIFLMLFPVSFYFSSVYTESLFLLEVVLSFYFARKNNWLLASVFGGLASGTRIAGIFLLPALLFELYWQNKDKIKKIVGKALMLLFLVPSGLFFYMRFLFEKYKDPFMFFNVQPYFGAGRENTKIILIYQVFYRYLKMIFSTKADPLFFAVWIEFLCAIFFIILIVKNFKKIRVSYWIFSILGFLAPSLTGSFLSLPRFSLIFFPCFISLALINSNKAKNIIKVIFLLLFIISTAMFLNGYWIS